MNWARLLFWRSSEPSAPVTDEDIERYRPNFPGAVRFVRVASWCVLYYLVLWSLVWVAYLAAWLSQVWSFGGRRAVYRDRLGFWLDEGDLGIILMVGLCMTALAMIVQYFLTRDLFPELGYPNWIRPLPKLGCGTLVVLVLLGPLSAVLILVLHFLMNFSLGRICERAGRLCGSESLRRTGGQAAINNWILVIDSGLLLGVLVFLSPDNPVVSFLPSVMVFFAVYSYAHLFLALRFAGRVLDRAGGSAEGSAKT